jgi:hypothetical protein
MTRIIQYSTGIAVLSSHFRNYDEHTKSEKQCIHKVALIHAINFRQVPSYLVCSLSRNRNS